MVGHFRKEKEKKWCCIRGDVLDLKYRLHHITSATSMVFLSYPFYLGSLFSAFIAQK